MRRTDKKGFTLTEVLLAMSIIGILAALVMPQLVKTIQKDKTGVILGKAVEQIELGCQNMIQAYNESVEAEGRASMADTLMAMDGDYDFTFNRLAPYIGVKNITVFNEGGGNRFDNTIKFRFNKFPAELQVPRNINLIAMVNPSRNTIVQNQVVIDVNGLQNRPNQFGRDRFRFELRNDGKLIPEGVNSNSCDGDNPTINANCTARVVKDGFKVKYNW